MEAGLQARSIKAKLAPVVEVIVAIGTCLVLGTGRGWRWPGSSAPGVLIVFLLYLGKMYKPMRDLSKMTDTVSKAVVGYERIQEVLDIESARPRPAGRATGAEVQGSHQLRARQLQLRRPARRAEGRQLHDRAGTGRRDRRSVRHGEDDARQPDSALLRSGVRVASCIDGTDVRRYRLKSLRDQISFVLQDTLLFRATIWENIAYGKPDASPGGDQARRRAGQRERVHRGDARRLRHDGRRARRHALRRPAPAHRHRPRDHSRHADPDSRRADRRAWTPRPSSRSSARWTR